MPDPPVAHLGKGGKTTQGTITAYTLQSIHQLRNA